jgi:serine/threonine protein kinase
MSQSRVSRKTSASTKINHSSTGSTKSTSTKSGTRSISEGSSSQGELTESHGFLSGVNLNPYIIKPYTKPWSKKDKLGKGSSGEVYKTTLNNEDVAVKVIKFKKESDQEDCETELKTMAFLMPDADPYMVKLLGFYFDDDKTPTTCTIALEYMPDGSLDDWINSETTTLFFTQAERRAGLLHLSQGLEHLHNKGVLHNDIKPHNVLIQDKKLKFADWGSATSTTSDQDNLGTPFYMAPELLWRLATVSKRSDIFSFCVLIVAVINKMSISDYYEKKHSAKVFATLKTAIDNGARPPISRDKSICPPKLARQLTLGFMKDPYRRPEAGDFVDCFREIEADDALDAFRKTESFQDEEREERPVGVRLRSKFDS